MAYDDRWGGCWALGLALSVLGMAACGDDGAPGQDDDSGGTAAATSAGTAGPADDGGVSMSGGASATSPSTATSPGTDGSSGGDSTATPTTMGDSTTGEPVELCNGWQENGATEPWLAVYGSGHAALESGGTFPIECGGQGFWMFPIYPELGGWRLADPMVSFDLQIDVEGYNDTPSGHFYDATGLYYGLECFNGGDELDGGFGGHACIAVFPPDGLEDLSVLDGLATTIHISLDTPSGPVVLDLTDMTLWAPADQVMDGCVF